MKLIGMRLSYIKSFKSLDIDLQKTKILVGQNDHGKSSILKIVDILLNRITKEMIEEEILSPDIAEKLLTKFSTNAKARRITLLYFDGAKEKQLHLSIRTDFTFAIYETIKRGVKSEPHAKTLFEKLQKTNKFILIPSIRDVGSDSFRQLFKEALQSHGLSRLVPTQAGGTTREYRKLKEIQEEINKIIKPYVDEALLPNLEKRFGFKKEHPFALMFDVDVTTISDWIRSHLSLAFQLDEGDESATLPLEEAGTGVQSAALLALHELSNQAEKNPAMNYFFAIEEPEAFLHPQKQKELFQRLQSSEKNNLRTIVTTHSPYIVSEASFSTIGLVRKEGKFSNLCLAQVASPQEEEMFNAYSNEVNSLILFSKKTILVEGESDRLVLNVILKKMLGPQAYEITVVSTAGNKNFSPYLRMIKSWKGAAIPHLVVTDFDSLLKEHDRAIISGLRAAGCTLDVNSLCQEIDKVIDKSQESEYEKVARGCEKIFKDHGFNVFIFTSDLEFSLITDKNKDKAIEIMTQESKSKKDYKTGYDILTLKKHLGSKGVPLNPFKEQELKIPYVLKKISETIDINNCHGDISRLIGMIKNL